MAITVTTIDFSQTSLSKSYAPFFAKVIDNAFTPEECNHLLSLAESSTWAPAGLSTGVDAQTVHTNFRNSDRVIVIDPSEADKIYQRLRPYVEEIHDIPPNSRWACITGKIGKTQGPVWSLAGINPRLSFLRYGPGHYFKPHCDGLNTIGSQQSFVTIHLYLNDSEEAYEEQCERVDDFSAALPTAQSLPTQITMPHPSTSTLDSNTNSMPDTSEPLRGGTTRFWTPDKKAFLDVHPKLGRVLVFQQRMLIHSGEEVSQGVKYTMRSDLMFVNEG